MLHFCTLFDINYVSKGLTLYDSLCSSIKEPFSIDILAIDKATAQRLSDIDYGENKVSISLLEELEIDNEELRIAKSLPATLYGSQRDNYMWLLCPWWTKKVMSMYNTDETIIYADSDICFYKSPQFIINEMKDKDMAIHSHRFSCDFDTYINDPKQLTGFFNVGVFAIKKSLNGMYLIERWNKLCLENKDPFRNRWGACGDQSWITQLYIEQKENICVFDDTLSHFAPWTEFPSVFLGNDMCIFKSQTQPIMFGHFSHFKYDLDNNTWSDNDHGEWLPTAKPEIKAYYERYFESIKQVHKKYTL